MGKAVAMATAETTTSISANDNCNPIDKAMFTQINVSNIGGRTVAIESHPAVRNKPNCETSNFNSLP